MGVEEWRLIEGYDGDYKISSFGRVKSYKKRFPRILVAHPTSGYGYLAVSLSRDGETKTKNIHRLVLEAFMGSPPAGEEAAHLSGDPKDNRLSNLIWTTRRENCRHKLRHGTQTFGEDANSAKLTDRQIICARLQLHKGKFQKDVAAALGVNVSTIKRMWRGQTWPHLPYARDTIRVLPLPGDE